MVDCPVAMLEIKLNVAENQSLVARRREV